MFWFVVFVLLLLVVSTAASSIVTVKPDEVAAYTVLGEYRGLLDPGMHTVTPFVSDIFRYEQSSQFAVTEESNTADGDRVEATVQVDLERGDIQQGYETETLGATDPIAELRDETHELLRAELRDRDSDAVLSAHVDIERAMARELRETAREHYHHLEGVDMLAIERAERPAAPAT